MLELVFKNQHDPTLDIFQSVKFKI